MDRKINNETARHFMTQEEWAKHALSIGAMAVDTVAPNKMTQAFTEALLNKAISNPTREQQVTSAIISGIRKNGNSDNLFMPQKTHKGFGSIDITRKPPKGTCTDVLDFYFQSGENQVDEICSVAYSLANDLTVCEKVDDKRARLIALLVQSREQLSRDPSEEAKIALHHISKALGTYLSRTRYYVFEQVKNLYHPYNIIDMEDMIIEGQIGFIEGLQKFDFSSDNLVLTYCQYRIRGKAIDHIRENSSTIRKPRSAVETASKLDNLGDYIDTKDPKYERALATRQKLIDCTPISFEDPVIDDEDLNLYDVVANANYYEDEIDSAETEQIINKVLSKLPEREEEIVRMRIGLPPFHNEHTLVSIGSFYGLTESRISQLLDKAVSKLKRYVILGELIAPKS